MAKVLRHHHVLAVHDVGASAAFYVEKLGFKIAMEPEGWKFVERDGLWIMLGECRDAIHPSQLGDHSYFAYLVVDDVDACHEEFRERGVPGLKPPETKPWGMREMGVTTIDGHRIMFGQEIS